MSEKYVSNSGKFAYTKDSDNIYGRDFSDIETASLKGTLADFLEDESEEDVVKESFIKNAKSNDFIGLDVVNEVECAAPTRIEDVIPSPKSFDEYDEVLKDDERIVFPIKAEEATYSKPDEYNPIKYVNEEENGAFIKKIEKESHNYKDKLANLYSDTSKINPYNKPIEEERVSLDSQEIFESQPQEDVCFDTKTNIASLQSDLGKAGIKLRVYNKENYTKKKDKNYINLSKITLVQGWVVWLIMAIEIIGTALLLNSNQLLPIGQRGLYYWAFGLSFIYPLIYTLEYIIDPYKKIISNFKLSINIFNKFLAMLINIVFVFAINLFFGMTSLNQLNYLSYWLLPTILCTNYIVSTLIYFILLKSKQFSI